MKFDWKKLDWLLAFPLAATVLALLYPGDTVWLGDEAGLLALALQANAEGTVAVHGLTGSMGVSYGALVVWFKQFLLHFTWNPVAIAGAGAVLALAASWGALWRLARIFHLPVGPVAAFFFCSPFVWFYLRQPWDNVYLMPLSLWYAVFLALCLREEKFAPVVGATVFLTAMIYLHPVSAAVPAGFAAGLLYFRRPMLRRDCWKFLLTGAGALLALSFWLVPLFRQYEPGRGAPPHPAHEALFGTLTSFRNLTGWGFTDRFSPESGLTLPGTLLVLSVPVIVFFVVLGIVAVIRRFRNGEANAFDRVGCCCIATIVLHVLFLTLVRLEHQVHYNSAILFAWLLLAWRGFVVLRADYRRIATVAFAFALLLEVGFLAAFLQQIHFAGGGSSPFYGTTLARQWEVAQHLTAARAANPELQIELRVERLRENPLPLQVLIALAMRTKLPPSDFYRQAVLLPSRFGSGIDLLLLEEPVEE